MSEPLNRSKRFFEALTGLQDQSNPPPWDDLVARDVARYSGDAVNNAPSELVNTPVNTEPVNIPVDQSVNTPVVNTDAVSTDEVNRAEYMREYMRRKRAAERAARNA